MSLKDDIKKLRGLIPTIAEHAPDQAERLDRILRAVETIDKKGEVPLKDPIVE